MIPAPGGELVAFADGTSRIAKHDEARALFRSGEVLIANTAFVAGRLRTAPAKPLFDLPQSREQVWSGGIADQQEINVALRRLFAARNRAKDRGPPNLAPEPRELGLQCGNEPSRS